MTIPTNPAPNEEWTNDATGVTYVWDGDRWFIKPGEVGDFVTEDEFAADQKRQDDDIEAGFDTQASLLIDNIAIKEEQVVQNDQINSLETQIQLLAGVKAAGRWTYRRNISSSSPRPPATGTFYGTHKDDINTVLRNWGDLNLLMISTTDKDGNKYLFSQFEEGDKIEILASNGNSACYGTVTNNPSIDSYGNMIVAVERYNGGPFEEAEYLVSAYRPGSSSPEVDLDILDDRYLVKTGDTMSGPLTIKQNPLLIKKNDDVTKQFKISPNVSDNFTNIYSFNSGGMRLRVSSDNTEANYKTFLAASYNDHTVGGVTQPVETQLNWLRTPTNAHHAANKQYVDDQVTEAKEYVDEQIEQIDLADNIIIPGHDPRRPPGLRFMYESGSGSVSSGKFKWYSDGGRKLRISATSQDFPWGINSPTGDISYSESHLFHIWATVTTNTGVVEWKVKTSGSFNRMDWHTNDILLYVPYNIMNGDFSVTAAYYISISGLF